MSRYGVAQRVEKVVRPFAPDPPHAVADPFAHRPERILRGFPERDHQPLGCENGNLFGRFREMHLPEDHEKALAVPFHLGALRDVQHVFQRQRVDPEPLADGAQDVGLGQSGHVEPQDPVLRGGKGREVGNGNRPFLAPLRVVQERLDPGGDGSRLRVRGQGSRRGPWRVIPFPAPFHPPTPPRYPACRSNIFISDRSPGEYRPGTEPLPRRPGKG